MVRYIIKRIIWLIPILLCIMVLIFTLMYFVPGDYATIVHGGESQETIQEFRQSLGLDDPYPVQLWRYLQRVILHFDFGKSYVYNTSVTHDLLERFPRTLTIALGTVVIVCLVGVSLGIVAAVKQNSFIDSFALAISLIGISMPTFWLGLLMIILFSLILGWLPPSGIGGIKYYILPCLANASPGIAGMVRLTRTTMLEVIRSDYVVTARSKGISGIKVLLSHALPNALIPIITSAGMTLGVMLGGALIIEIVFSIPGIGSYLVQGINNRDYPAVEGATIFLAFVFGMVMLLVDLLYALVDPRIKAQFKGIRGI
jgi:ABC-type dipeptide/oligopeptide/nickel transport system permease component